MKEWERWESDWSQYQIDQIWARKAKEEEWRFNSRYKVPAEFAQKHARSVLDIGCGGGILCRAISELDKSIYYEGIDITPKMINAARRLFPGIVFEVRDATSLPYSDNAFGLCVVSHVLEHQPLDRGQQIVSEAMRIAEKAVILIFFIKPTQIQHGNIAIRYEDGFYVNTYDHGWLMETIQSFDKNCAIDCKQYKQKGESNTFYIITKR